MPSASSNFPPLPLWLCTTSPLHPPPVVRCFPSPSPPPVQHHVALFQPLFSCEFEVIVLIFYGTAEVSMESAALRSSIHHSVSSMSSTSSSPLQSLLLAPVWHTDSFGKYCKSMKQVPSFSVAAKDLDMSSNEASSVPYWTLQLLISGHTTPPQRSSCSKSPCSFTVKPR